MTAVQKKSKWFPEHSSRWLLSGLILTALALSAWAGAAWQAARTVAGPLPAAAPSSLEQRTAAQLQDGLAALAGRVGELQGRILAMETLRSRVAKAAGLGYAAPELAAEPSAPEAVILDDIPSAPGPSVEGQAARLGQRIDHLAERLLRQEDAYALVDVALSRQAGLQAGLPTALPVNHPYLSSSFGWRRHPVSGRSMMHEGLDFVAPRNTPIRAASGGVVVRAGAVRGYGRMVEIDHGNGLHSRYAHASRVLVKVGDLVEQGDVIARVGSTGYSTGPHLHFEIRMADYPLDPEPFLRLAARALAEGVPTTKREASATLARRGPGLAASAGG